VKQGTHTRRPLLPAHENRAARNRWPAPRVLAYVLAGCAALIVALSATAAPTDTLHSECGGTPPPLAYPPVGAAPAVGTWTGANVTVSPTAEGCRANTPYVPHLTVSVAGRFRGAYEVDDLLTRFGAVSELLAVRYWSVSDRSWRPLVSSATALVGSAAGAPRGNFSAEELRSGRSVYLAQRDSRAASEAVYRLRVRECTRNRLVVETESTTPIRWWGVTLFSPGDVQSLYVLERADDGVWSYSSATTIVGALWITASHDKSYINRLVALYRHTAGIPSETEPPAAP
jgi:hypothetical protein